MTDYVERGSRPPHLIDEHDPPAIALLKEEHQMFRALFDLVETVDRKALFPVVGEICLRLTMHMILEEEFLYPALKPIVGVDEVDEGIVEHQLARTLISEIMDMTGREEIFRAKVHVLGEEIAHHIDEEDCVLFRDARQAWEAGKVDLVEIGTQMRARRRDLYDLVGSVAADSSRVDMDPIGDAAEVRSPLIEEEV